MKIPRNVSADFIIKQLLKLGYEITRQKGSHIRLKKKYFDGEHHITIPNHNPIKIGTLNNILNDISLQSKVKKEELIEILFS